MAKKGDGFYFDNFAHSAEMSCEAAILLKTILEDFNRDNLNEKLDAMHEIEHHADMCKHDLINELVRAFMTPIEREDIIKLGANLDDVTDSLEDILIHIYITDVKTIRSDSLEFMDVIIKCCKALHEMLQEFRNFKKSKKLQEMIIEINHLEEVGDKMYINAMHNLHRTSDNALEVIAWREIYGFFEKCCDACEHVADIVESIAIENT